MLPETRDCHRRVRSGLPPSSSVCAVGPRAPPHPALEGKAHLCLRDTEDRRPDREVSRRPWQVMPTPQVRKAPSSGRGGQSTPCQWGGVGTRKLRRIVHECLASVVKCLPFLPKAHTHLADFSKCTRPSSIQTVKTRTGKGRCN